MGGKNADYLSAYINICRDQAFCFVTDVIAEMNLDLST